MEYSERHKNFPNTVIISHPHNMGGNRKDAYMWMAELDGEVWDYGNKAYLISDAKYHERPYVVLRIHRDGTTSVIEEKSKY